MKKIYLVPLWLAAAQSLSGTQQIGRMIPTRRVASVTSRIKNTVARRWRQLSFPAKVVCILAVATILAFVSTVAAVLFVGFSLVATCSGYISQALQQVSQALQIPIRLIGAVLQAVGVPSSFAKPLAMVIFSVVVVLVGYGIYRYVRAYRRERKERVSLKENAKGWLEDTAKARRPLKEQKEAGKNYCATGLSILIMLCSVGYAIEELNAQGGQHRGAWGRRNVPPPPFTLNENGDIVERRPSVEDLRNQFNAIGDPFSPQNQQSIESLTDEQLISGAKNLMREISSMEKEQRNRGATPIPLRPSRTSVVEVDVEIEEEEKKVSDEEAGRDSPLSPP